MEKNIFSKNSEGVAEKFGGKLARKLPANIAVQLMISILTKQELQQELGITPSAVSKIVNGKNATSDEVYDKLYALYQDLSEQTLDEVAPEDVDYDPHYMVEDVRKIEQYARDVLYPEMDRMMKQFKSEIRGTLSVTRKNAPDEPTPLMHKAKKTKTRDDILRSYQDLTAEQNRQRIKRAAEAVVAMPLMNYEELEGYTDDELQSGFDAWGDRIYPDYEYNADGSHKGLYEVMDIRINKKQAMYPEKPKKPMTTLTDPAFNTPEEIEADRVRYNKEVEEYNTQVIRYNTKIQALIELYDYFNEKDLEKEKPIKTKEQTVYTDDDDYQGQ